MTSSNEQQPNKEGLSITAAQIRKLVEVSVEAEWNELCKLEELDEEAEHINARVAPAGGSNWTVYIGAKFIQNGLDVWGGMSITIHEDHLRTVYEGHLISTGEVEDK